MKMKSLRLGLKQRRQTASTASKLPFFNPQSNTIQQENPKIQGVRKQENTKSFRGQHTGNVTMMKTGLLIHRGLTAE